MVEVVEDIEEFFLRLLLVDDELEIVDDEAVEFAEFEVEFFAFAGTDSIDEIGVEMRDGSVEDFVIGIATEKFVADGLDEVGFAEAGTAIKEEGVVAVAGVFDDVFGGGNGEIVVGADDEVIEGVFVVEAVAEGGLGLFTAGGSANVVFDGANFGFGDFAGADFGFDLGLDFKIDGVDFEIVVFEGGGDEVEVATAELFDKKGIFDTNANVTVFGGDE